MSGPAEADRQRSQMGTKGTQDQRTRRAGHCVTKYTHHFQTRMKPLSSQYYSPFGEKVTLFEKTIKIHLNRLYLLLMTYSEQLKHIIRILRVSGTTWVVIGKAAGK